MLKTERRTLEGLNRNGTTQRSCHDKRARKFWLWQANKECRVRHVQVTRESVGNVAICRLERQRIASHEWGIWGCTPGFAKSKRRAGRLHDDQQTYSRQLDLKLAEKNDLSRHQEQEGNRNRSLNSNLYDVEAKTRAAEEALAVSRRELDDLRFGNQSTQQRNDDVRAEIDALHYHCNVLQGQNRDLNIELERFVQTDE